MRRSSKRELMRQSSAHDQPHKKVLFRLRYDLVSDLIQLQEKLVLNEMSPADIEKKTDAEVNQYWKHHSEEAKNDHAQIEPEKHHNEETKEDTTNPSTQSQPEEEIPPV